MAWAVDYSGASGCVGLVVNVGGEPGKAAARESAKATPLSLEAGGTTFHLLMLHAGEPPKPEVRQDGTIHLGKQTIRHDGTQIVLGVFNAIE